MEQAHKEFGFAMKAQISLEKIMVEFNGNDDDFEKICLKGGVVKIIDKEIDCLK